MSIVESVSLSYQLNCYYWCILHEPTAGFSVVAMPATDALRYIQSLIEESIRSSWAAANGLLGAALGGAAMIWRGVLPLVSTDLTNVSNWVLSFAIYAIGSWIVLFIANLILIAPYRSWQKSNSARQR
jgi:hypothetical protein